MVPALLEVAELQGLDPKYAGIKDDIENLQQDYGIDTGSWLP